MRVAPYTHTCHVCGARFKVQPDPQRFTPGRGHAMTPSECPRCAAPLKRIPRENLGASLDAVLAHYGARQCASSFGATPEEILERISGRPEDVDRHLDLLRKLDFQVWEDNVRGGYDRGRIDSVGREEIEIIRKAREDAAAGRLMPSLEAAAARAKVKLVAEREKHLEILRQRGGGGTTR